MDTVHVDNETIFFSEQIPYLLASQLLFVHADILLDTFKNHFEYWICTCISNTVHAHNM